MRRRDGIICALIFAYCLAICLYMFKPQLILADEVTDPETSERTEVRPVIFESLPDSPDPNEVFKRVNTVRAGQSSNHLVANEKLAEVAMQRAQDMATRQYYAHKNPDGKYYYDLFQQLDIHADYSCENLDIVFVPDINQFINEWMASTKGHRNCMINENLRYAGYAVTKMMLIQYDGREVPAYLVVAIHATNVNDLR